jgi:hypothetical protein
LSILVGVELVGAAFMRENLVDMVCQNERQLALLADEGLFYNPVKRLNHVSY